MSETAAKPSRSATRKSEATRARVLDAAARVLAREGYAGTRLNDIGAEANIQAPAIYYYFSSREELIDEVADIGATTLLNEVKAALDALGPDAGPVERLEAAAASHLDVILRNIDYARAALRNAEQYPSASSMRHLATLKRYDRLWSTLLRDAHKAGAIAADLDLTLVRHLALGALNSVMDWWAPGRATPAKVMAQTQLLLRRALAS